MAVQMAEYHSNFHKFIVDVKTEIKEFTQAFFNKGLFIGFFIIAYQYY